MSENTPPVEGQANQAQGGHAAAQPPYPIAPQPPALPYGQHAAPAQPPSAQNTPLQPYAGQVYSAPPQVARPYGGPPYAGPPYTAPARDPRYGVQPYAPGYPAPGYAAARPSSGLALASMICGIAGIVIVPFSFWIFVPLLVPIAAIVLGHMALAQLKQRPDLGGKGMAIAGLVMGYVPLAAALAMIVLMVLSMLMVGMFAFPFAVS